MYKVKTSKHVQYMYRLLNSLSEVCKYINLLELCIDL